MVECKKLEIEVAVGEDHKRQVVNCKFPIWCNCKQFTLSLSLSVCVLVSASKAGFNF